MRWLPCTPYLHECTSCDTHATYMYTTTIATTHIHVHHHSYKHTCTQPCFHTMIHVHNHAFSDDTCTQPLIHTCTPDHTHAYWNILWHSTLPRWNVVPTFTTNRPEPDYNLHYTWPTTLVTCRANQAKSIYQLSLLLQWLEDYSCTPVARAHVYNNTPNSRRTPHTAHSQLITPTQSHTNLRFT